MNRLKLVIVSFCAILLGVSSATNAKADGWDEKTIVTFNEPVEIPGQVLTAGTYVFKLLNSVTDRNIVQIFNKDENHVYATILAIPDYCLKVTGKPVFKFEERPLGSPEALKAWFYPGDDYGEELVYPKNRAVEPAYQTNQPVPSMPSVMAANTTTPTKSANEAPVLAMKNAPLKAQKSSGEEVEVAKVIEPPPVQTATTRTRAKPHKHLPKTASELPLAGLIGLMSVGAAVALRTISKRIA